MSRTTWLLALTLSRSRSSSQLYSHQCPKWFIFTSMATVTPVGMELLSHLSHELTTQPVTRPSKRQLEVTIVASYSTVHVSTLAGTALLHWLIRCIDECLLMPIGYTDKRSRPHRHTSVRTDQSMKTHVYMRHLLPNPQRTRRCFRE